jgi:hypothetical protein
MAIFTRTILCKKPIAEQRAAYPMAQAIPLHLGLGADNLNL